MTTRSYNQFCALAFALDAIGERWTLLIIRELLSGPRRYKDLLAGLPEISTNLLSDRLKSLEKLGIVCKRVLPPPAGSTVYELTPFGMALEKAVLELGRWGSYLLPESLEGVHMPSTGATALAIKAFFQPEMAEGIDEIFDVILGDEILQVHFKDGTINVHQGRSRKADAIFHTDIPSWMAVFSGQVKPEKAIERGMVRIEGDPKALQRFLSYSGVPTSN